jgi:hypothetical protein
MNICPPVHGRIDLSTFQTLSTKPIPNRSISYAIDTTFADQPSKYVTFRFQFPSEFLLLPQGGLRSRARNIGGGSDFLICDIDSDGVRHAQLRGQHGENMSLSWNGDRK